MLKKIIPIILIVFLINLTACDIYINKEKGAINGLYEKEVLTSNVTIKTYVGFETLYSQGSGVIFYKDESSYYALTNNHVLYGSNSYKVVDCYGDKYWSELIYSDAKYDLAILRFVSEKQDYFVPTIANNDPTEKTPIISIGSPNGIINSISLGIVEKYESVADVDEQATLNEVGSEVSFNVISHTAKVDGGSSGGAIFNYSYEICGINFACGINSSGEFVSGYAIQPSKILEFLNLAQFDV